MTAAEIAALPKMVRCACGCWHDPERECWACMTEETQDGE